MIKALVSLFAVTALATAAHANTCISPTQARTIVTNASLAIQSELESVFSEDNAEFYTERILESVWSDNFVQAENQYKLVSLNNYETPYCAAGSELFYNLSVSCQAKLKFEVSCEE